MVVVARDRQAGRDAKEESHRHAKRQPLVGQAPGRSPTGPNSGRQGSHQQQPLDLHEPEKHAFRVVGRRQDDARHEHEIGEDEGAEHPVGGQLDGRRAGDVFACAPVRSRQKGHERSQPPAQAEHRVPLDPRDFSLPDLAGDPANVAQDPQRHADEERIPEEALEPEPLPASAKNDDAGRYRRQQQPGVAVDRPRRRIPAKQPAQKGIDGQVKTPGQQILRCNPK